jgi:hypothetical protein
VPNPYDARTNAEAAAGGAAIGDAAAHAGSAPSVRVGALSRLYAWSARLPGHGWYLVPASALGLLLWSDGLLWATGRLAVGSFDPTLTVSVVYAPYVLGVLAYLNHAAARALDAFWPATGWSDRDRASWVRAFTTVEAGIGLPCLILGIALAIGAFLSAPAAVVGTDIASRSIYAAAYAPSAILGYAMALIAIVHTWRQLRLVARIHQDARAIDPFDRRPVYAFSRFTAQIGLAFLVSGYYTLSVNASFQSGNLVGLVVLAAIIGLGAAAFVLPLWGIHGRLVREKEALFVGVDGRSRKLVEELYRRIDAGEFDGTKVVNEAIAAAGAVRERIGGLPTWPWPPQVLRGFVTALLLPIVVYLLTRLAGVLIGA